MAVVNTKASVVTGLDATPRVKAPMHLLGGVLRETVGTVEIAAADCYLSVFRVCRVHSSWRISEITRFNDTLTSFTSVHVGLYKVAEDGGAEADRDLFATALNIATASKVGVNDTFEELDIANIQKPVWQLLGLSADPGVFYDLAYTAISKGAATGTLSVRVRYVATAA